MIRLSFLQLVAVVALTALMPNASAKAPNTSAEFPSIHLNVYKSPTCACCKDWMKHMGNNGFELQGHHPERLSEFKVQHGIEARYQSCHTAITQQGFRFEGHIPAKFVKQFLARPPAGARGLAVPGMPLGSPGMEVGERFSPYQIILLKSNGTHELYGDVNQASEQY